MRAMTRQEKKNDIIKITFLKEFSCVMTAMAINNKKSAFIALWLCLGQKDVSKPIECNLVICLALRGCLEVLILIFLKL